VLPVLSGGGPTTIIDSENNIPTGASPSGAVNAVVTTSETISFSPASTNFVKTLVNGGTAIAVPGQLLFKVLMDQAFGLLI